MTEADGEAIPVGTRVSFPYGGSRRTGKVAEVSRMADASGSANLSYLIEVGAKRVFVQGGVVLAGDGNAAFDPVAEGVAYGRKRPRNTNRRR